MAHVTNKQSKHPPNDVLVKLLLFFDSYAATISPNEFLSWTQKALKRSVGLLESN